MSASFRCGSKTSNPSGLRKLNAEGRQMAPFFLLSISCTLFLKTAESLSGTGRGMLWSKGPILRDRPPRFLRMRLVVGRSWGLGGCWWPWRAGCAVGRIDGLWPNHFEEFCVRYPHTLSLILRKAGGLSRRMGCILRRKVHSLKDKKDRPREARILNRSNQDCRRPAP
jgi:hypothetical protein